MLKKISVLVSIFLITLIIMLLFYNQQKSLNNDIIAIIRSSNENTKEKSYEYLNKIFKEKNIIKIENTTPLIEASKKTFEEALKQKKKWILVIDSDVFLFEDKFKIFVSKAKKQIKKDKNAFCFQAEFFDKLSQSNRLSGIYLYYRPNLNYSDKYIKLCQDKIRPEACIRDQITTDNKSSYQFDELIGIHDFFQTPFDIVKKTILHSKKNNDEIKARQEIWQNLSKTDSDFIWTQKGYEIYQKINKDEIMPDNKYFDKILANYNIPKTTKKPTNKEIDSALLKYNTKSIEEASKTELILKIKPLVKLY